MVADVDVYSTGVDFLFNSNGNPFRGPTGLPYLLCRMTTQLDCERILSNWPATFSGMLIAIVVSVAVATLVGAGVDYAGRFAEARIDERSERRRFRLPVWLEETPFVGLKENEGS